MTAALLDLAVGYRHGLVPDVQLVPTTQCDIAGVWHASVPPAPETGAASPGGPPAGGAAWTAEAARHAAVGEALERYAGAVCPLPAVPLGGGVPAVPIDEWTLFSPEQRRRPDFPFAAGYDQASYTPAWSLSDNRRGLVPRALVGLSDPSGHGFASSSGLAAGPSRALALLRATQELVERDALMTTWNHGLPGRVAALPEPYSTVVADRGGTATAVDVTPAYSPHPVAVVVGEVPRRGRRRIALGAACRSTWAEALDKAFLEWAQGIVFAGVWCSARPDLRFGCADDVRTFEDHAAYYTAHPQRWDRVPLGKGRATATPPPDGPPDLAGLVTGLAAGGVRLFYRDVTTVDVAQVGVTVARVLSPDLTPIHCEHAWPFLGGRAADVAWRYPGAAPQTAWPSPFPHPLG